MNPLLLQYLGHSCFLLRTPKAKILFDPFLTGNPLAVVQAEKVDCDFILVSHAHVDHFGDAVTISKRTGATLIAAYELALMAEGLGAKVHPMGCGGGKDFTFGRVQLTIAHHTSSVEGASGLVSVAGPVGFLVKAEGKTVYFAGDTALSMEMELLGRRHQIDLALLPIGDNFTMGPIDAAEAVRMLQAKRAVPMHYNTFPLIQVDPNLFVSETKKLGYQAEVMAVGATLEI